MSPGINDHPHNTGTLPKSNRRSDRNKERDRALFNQNCMYSSRTHRVPPAQHSNNLFDWHPLSERQVATTSASRTAKNSNARPTCSAYDLADHHHQLGAYNSHSRLYPNLQAREDSSPAWVKMTPPVDSRAQSPANLIAKPTNTDKMPERGQVEGRLNQIREYIKVTSTMMDSLSESRDPRAQAQREKLGRMVEDLYDSEQKLTKLMENCHKYWRCNENGELDNEERSREQELVKKIEDSQRKLDQLQEHQTQLVSMQLSARERLNEARQAQQRLICVSASDEDNASVGSGRAGEPQPNGNLGSNVEQLERETEALRGKLQQLENKKRHMDHLVQELQAVELSERASCSSEGSRAAGQRDKVAELEAMKAQLNHLKALMNEATRESEQPVVSEPEHDDELLNNGLAADEVHDIAENDVNVDSVNSYNDLDDVKPKLSCDPPTVQQIQAVTRELKEQQQLLLTARAELRRLKQGSANSRPASGTSCTPPPPQQMFAEKKQSNHAASNNDLRLAQNKRRQLEDFMRKDQSHGSSVNQNEAPEWSGSRRGSNSHHSHVSTPANLWPPPTNIAPTHEHSVDPMSAAENLLDMGNQPPLVNGFGGNYWEMPAVMNQPPQGANASPTEYYRQLLLGSQALQLQMMSTTIQQCCQLLWTQQREMQSMKNSITQLQVQVRQQSQQRASNNLDLSEEHSNLGRAAAQQHYGSLDPSTLPPSSSLPNLVSLPGASPAPPSVISTPAGCQQQQLNNQVPPGNRANNYWDNFRSYSRQNLLSGSFKATTDASAGASAHPTSSTNSATGVGIGAHPNNKCNRHIDLDNLPSLPTSDVQQYSLNLQQDQASATPQNNCVPNNGTQQQAQQPVNVAEVPMSATNDVTEPDSSLAKKMHSDVKVLLKRCLKVLEARPENESPLPSSNMNNSSDSSDNESEAGGPVNAAASNHNGNVKVEHQLPDFIEPASSAQMYTSPLPEFLEHEYKDVLPNYDNSVICLSPISSTTQNRNEITFELATSDNLNSTQQFCENDEVSNIAITGFEIHLDELSAEDEQDRAEDKKDRAEYVMFDRAHNMPASNQPQLTIGQQYIMQQLWQMKCE